MTRTPSPNGRPSPAYPDRPSHFAHKFCRLLTKTCAAQDIGPDGCWLLSVIAMLEDTKRYTSPVTFYNAQLMAISGFTREHTLIAVRRRAVEAGWLHYEPGAKRHPGRYWVTIPNHFAEIPDGPCDEYTDESVSESDCTVPDTLTKASAKTEGKRQRKRRESVSPSSLTPNPSPNPNEEGAPAKAGTRVNSKKAKRKTYGYTADFERWFAVYPRRIGKKAAAAAFVKALTSIDLDELCHITATFARSDIGTGPKSYIPHPATWLNQARWEDDPAEWKRDADQTSGRNGNGQQSATPRQPVGPSGRVPRF